MLKGLFMSLQSCDLESPPLKLRAGRIDATEAGPLGVPEPTTDLPTTLARFAKAGFSQSDAIGLV